MGDPDAAGDEGRVRPIIEEALLEARALEHAARMLPDGPGPGEALAAEARLSGLWHATARKLRSRRKG